MRDPLASLRWASRSQRHVENVRTRIMLHADAPCMLCKAMNSAERLLGVNVEIRVEPVSRLARLLEV